MKGNSEEICYGLDIILLLMGCKMYRSSKFFDILNYLFLIHFSLFVYYVIVIKLIFIPTDPDTYFTFSITVIHFTQLINHHILYFKIKHLRRIHILLYQELSCENMKYLKKCCHIMLIFYLAISSLSAYLYIHFIIPSDEMILIINNFYAFTPTTQLSISDHIFVHYLMTLCFSFLRNSWLMISTFTYFHFLDCFKFYYQNMMDQVCILIQGRGLNRKIFDSYSRKQERMIDQVTQFERQMNFFPFLWFSFNFVSLIAILVSTVRIKGAGFHTFSVESIYNILNIIFTAIVAGKVSDMKNDMKLQREQVTRGLFLERETTSNFQLLLGFLLRLREEKTNFTGWQLFALDKKVLPEFVGSLVTFSVLFVQLLQLDETNKIETHNTKNSTGP